MSAHAHPAAVGGKMLNGTMKVLLALFGASALVMAYRFVTGVGYVSNMTDGFTWGIWEPVNVVVFTGIGAGAYATGLLCYAFGQGRYHGLIRPAVLVGAISYTLGGSSILIALGRYWNAYWLPWVPYWNLASALLEVAICVMMYLTVLWIEVLPAVFEGLEKSPSPRWSSIGKAWGPRLAKAMPFLIAAAIVLPTMHQSSLGGLMLIAGPKIHPFWHTALLPTLFLVSCLSMGLGSVVVVLNILRITWNAAADQKLFVGLSKVNAGLLGLYSVVRVADLAAHGKLSLLGANFPTLLFVAEMACFVVPAVMMLMPGVQANRGKLFGAAALAVFAGAAYRCNAYMSMYRPAGWTDGVPNPAGWEYWPSLGETIVTVGMAAVGVAVFVFISRKFPVVVLEDRAHSNVASGQVKAVASR